MLDALLDRFDRVRRSRGIRGLPRRLDNCADGWPRRYRRRDADDAFDLPAGRLVPVTVRRGPPPSRRRDQSPERND